MIVFEDDDSDLYDPSKDGITHINTYSRGKTLLGRMLSNFYHAPFEHPEFGKFTSVEGFYYWYKTGAKYDTLRSLSGYKAKEEGKKYSTIEVDDFCERVLECLVLKITSNTEIYNELKDSTLPFVHYYYYGDNNPKVHKVPSGDWLMEALEDIRKLIKED